MFGSLCSNEFTLPVLTISIAALAHISRRRSALVIVMVVGTFQNFSVLSPVYKSTPTMTKIT